MSWEIPNSGRQIRIKRRAILEKINRAYRYGCTSWSERPHFQRGQDSFEVLLIVFDYGNVYDILV